MRYRTLLVDDEPLALQRLQRLLAKWSNIIEIVGTADNGTTAVSAIHTLRPDLVFLDIQMPEMSGFEVLEKLEYTPLVIFSTAYDQYALQAFEVHSIDYLLKPVDPARLEKTIAKLQRLTSDDAGELRNRIQQALTSMARPPVRRMQVKTGDRIKLLSLSDIVFFKASEKYVEVHTADKSYLITKTLAQLETELPEDEFIRIHRSAIINIDFIDEITRSFKGAYSVRLKDRAATELSISRGYKSRLGLS